MRRRPRGRRRSVGRGACRPAIEPRKRRSSRAPTPLATRKATRTGALARAPGRPGVVGDPGMCGRSLRGNREISRPAGGRDAVWSASGRRGAEADDARAGEVRPRHSSEEAGEQGRATGGGAGGAKGGGRGERGTSNARAGRRTGKACPRRWTAYGKPQGKGRRNGSPRSSTTSASTCSGTAFFALKRDAAPGVDGVTWRDYEADLERRLADLHAAGPSGSVPGAALPAAVHTQAGRAAAPAGDRGAGGQDRPEGDRGGAERDLRGGLPRVLVRVPARSAASMMRWTRWWSGSPAPR